MKRLYAKYKNRLEIVGIDCRDTPEKWLGGDRRTPAAVGQCPEPGRYAVRRRRFGEIRRRKLPDKVLVDPEGRIVGKFAGEGPDFYEKLAEALK